MSNLITQGIKVSVRTAYQADYSRPFEGKYIHAYRITIENMGSTTVQLISRHWRIQDSNGHTQEVRGEGVVGQQPVLAPGETHQYVSWCNLRTDIGRMWGTYQMIEEKNGAEIEVHIPEFQLIAPFKLN